MSNHRGQPSRRLVLCHIQRLLQMDLINSPPRINQIPRNAITRAALFLTHQAPHNLAQCNLFYSICSLRATSPQAYLHTQKWNLRSSVVRAPFPHSQNNSRAQSVFPPHLSSTNPEDTYHHTYPRPNCLLCSMRMRVNLPLRGACMRCRPLYLQLCRESLQASKRSKRCPTMRV